MRARLAALAAGSALALAAAAGTCASAQAAVVNPEASVRPIITDAAVRPIDLEASVVPLEVVRTRGRRTTVTLAADVLFAFNKASLTPAARRTVARVARRIKGAGSVRVDGYTDSIGSDAYNLRLSRRRALAVVAALRSATSGTRLSARGHGESEPVAANESGGRDNPAGRAKNRRVTITYGAR